MNRSYQRVYGCYCESARAGSSGGPPNKGHLPNERRRKAGQNERLTREGHVTSAGSVKTFRRPAMLKTTPLDCAFLSRVSTHTSQVSRRFWQRVCLRQRVSPLNSQVAFHSQSSGVVFNIAGLRKVFTDPAEITCPSRVRRSFCPAFRRLSFGGCPLLREPPESPARADAQ